MRWFQSFWPEVAIKFSGFYVRVKYTDCATANIEQDIPQVHKSELVSSVQLFTQFLIASGRSLSVRRVLITMKKRSVLIIIICICALLALTLGLLFGLLLLPTVEVPDAADAMSNLITEQAQFPNGSFLLSMNAVQLDSQNTTAPKNFSTDTLHQWGVRVDDSSLVAESGRLSFLYVWLPGSPLGEGRLKRDISSSVTGIGIRFGNASSLNVVPTTLVSSPESGVRVVQNLADSSTVYEVQVRMPTAMCTNAGACTVTTWQPYAMFGNSRAAAGPSVISSLPVACGSQCSFDASSPCASSSCDVCGGQQVAGADTPVTRRYRLGTKTGTIPFSFDTYSIKDRVTVRHGDQIVFDSGCVGMADSKDIAVSGNVEEVRVDVEPNCEGTTGTAWWFRLSCPSPCGEFDKGVKLMSGVSEIKDGGNAYISKDGGMPPLSAYYCGASSQQSIRWTLEIEPTIGRAASKYQFCQKRTLTSQGAQFEMSGQFSQGGRVSLSWSGDVRGSLKFEILGTQPTADSVTAFIRQSTTLWYAEPIAKHENGLRQFEAGRPKIAADDGVGIFQLTTPRPTCEQVWNWKSNVLGGINRLNQVTWEANTWMARQRSQARQEAGREVPVPDVTEANCLFRENTSRTIEHAVAIKAYNSATQHYCAWDNPNKQWKFNKLNHYVTPFNYVERVCGEVSP